MSTVSIGCLVQARMSSRRFPGKTLYHVVGRPMLGYLIESLAHCTVQQELVVVTSTDDSDTAIFNYCRELRVTCYRGSLEDVAGRFLAAARHYGFDAFVRINGDSPLLDFRLVDKAVQLYRKNTPDLVTNVLKRTFPKGQSVEVVKTGTFENAYQKMESDEKEHVTQYFYKNPRHFRIIPFESGQNYGSVQQSVDTREDMEHFENTVGLLSGPHWKYTYEELYALQPRMGSIVS